MIVVDASVVVDLLLSLVSATRRLLDRSTMGQPLAAPHLLDAEVGHALRRGVLRGVLPSSLAGAALDDLARLRLERDPHTSLLARACQLRRNASFCDALYLALTEALAAPLLTRDRALARVPGADAEIEVIG